LDRNSRSFLAGTRDTGGKPSQTKQTGLPRAYSYARGRLLIILECTEIPETPRKGVVFSAGGAGFFSALPVPLPKGMKLLPLVPPLDGGRLLLMSSSVYSTKLSVACQPLL
jgi:hypothetical protein